MTNNKKLISDEAVAEAIGFLQSLQDLVAASRDARIWAVFNRDRILLTGGKLHELKMLNGLTA